MIINHLALIASNISWKLCERMNGLHAITDPAGRYEENSSATRYTNREKTTSMTEKFSLLPSRSLTLYFCVSFLLSVSNIKFKRLFRFNSDQAMSVPAEFSRTPCSFSRSVLVRPRDMYNRNSRESKGSHRKIPRIPRIPSPYSFAIVCA